MNFTLKDNTFLVCIVGSRAYGTNTPTSDVDIKGVCFAPKNIRNGFLNKFEQCQDSKEMSVFKEYLDKNLQEIVQETKLEGTIFELRKFMDLAADANPNIWDILFAHNDSIIFNKKEYSDLLFKNRSEFVSLRALYSFRGYAISQLKRIELHRKHILNPLTKPPERSDFGLKDNYEIPKEQLLAIQSQIKQRMDYWEIDYGDLEYSQVLNIQEKISKTFEELLIGTNEKYWTSARLLGFNDNYIQYLEKENQYFKACDEWQRYKKWKLERNKDRFSLEEKYGYDTKHASHLVRLMTSCKEILLNGEVNIKRQDADFLKEIRNGIWSYEKLLSWSKDEDKNLIELSKQSKINKKPNLNKINDLCCQLYDIFDKNN